MLKNFAVGRSRQGFPVVYEAGGGHGLARAGSCTVVCTEHGATCRPLYVYADPVANTRQAVIVVTVGMYLVTGRRVREELTVDAWRVHEIVDTHLVAEHAGRYCDVAGALRDEFPPELQDALVAALYKLECEGCRCVHFAHDVETVLGEQAAREARYGIEHGQWSRR